MGKQTIFKSTQIAKAQIS
jgi:hypothetical protein